MSLSTSSRRAAMCSLAVCRVKVSFSFCEMAWASWPLVSSSFSSSDWTRRGLSGSRRRRTVTSSSAAWARIRNASRSSSAPRPVGERPSRPSESAVGTTSSHVAGPCGDPTPALADACAMSADRASRPIRRARQLLTNRQPIAWSAVARVRIGGRGGDSVPTGAGRRRPAGAQPAVRAHRAPKT